MNNAEKFKQIFGLYATELWSMPESDFLEWLNRDVETTQIDHIADIGKKVCVDTISRQAALDAIMGQPPEPHHPSWYAAQIEKLPAVQPEIIRCKDCDWWTKQEDSVQGRCELMQMYPAGGWYCGNARRRSE